MPKSAKPFRLASAIKSSTEAVTKTWALQRRAEERSANARRNRYRRLVKSERVTIRNAAFQVMKESYQKASANGTLPANPRQIYYAARRSILNATGKDALQSGYFLQTLLRDYMENNDCSAWDVVWDARGHFTEPHTGERIPIGTLQVRQYLSERPVPGAAVNVNSSELYPTKGPEQRYKNVVFIEKEGFDPLWAASRIAERLDIALMSTKGMSVSASRLLIDRLVSRGVEKIFVLHDFDISGFSIVGTLGTDSRVYKYNNDVTGVIVDIGLRFADVEDMKLLSEPFATDEDWRAISRTLKRHGATEKEIEFLKDARVELNAMDSQQFVDFLEQKLKEHGVKKVVPDDAVMVRHARRVLAETLTANALKSLRETIQKEAAAIALPEDLRGQVENELAENPALPWDVAVARIIGKIGGAA
jgi:hypothetical protein